MQVQVNVLIRISQRLIFSLRRACENPVKRVASIVMTAIRGRIVFLLRKYVLFLKTSDIVIVSFLSFLSCEVPLRDRNSNRLMRTVDALLKPPFHCVDNVLNRRDDLSTDERHGLIPDKPHHIILAEKSLCVPDHSFIVPVILHGLHADPCDE